jgi:hypothetical protein
MKQEVQIILTIEVDTEMSESDVKEMCNGIEEMIIQHGGTCNSVQIKEEFEIYNTESIATKFNKSVLAVVTGMDDFGALNFEEYYGVERLKNYFKTNNLSNDTVISCNDILEEYNGEYFTVWFKIVDFVSDESFDFIYNTIGDYDSLKARNIYKLFDI